MDCKKETDRICKFIKDTVKDAGAKGVVLGLSGGLDSAVVYKLCVKALGKDRITPEYMPEKIDLHSDEYNRIKSIIDTDFYVPSYFVLEGIIKSIWDEFNNKIVHGNVLARLRMMILYGLANENNYLVIGTTNKSEYMIGYFTKYGDGASDFEPIQHLYKTEVYELAKYLGVPDSIIKAKPSAGLWEGQTDEDEIGMSYERLDKILEYFEQPHLLVGHVFNYGLSEKDIKRVEKMIETSEHKRRLPRCLKNRSY